ncbi:hypothetical protein QCA50_020724 [Cerrena zonata]|uniref:Transposase n=1 Tax=Cerrena zonata TaxID=2478898 RepID=A0AAW0FBL4_9APHY
MLEEFHITEKLLSITTDNASPNDVMIKVLGDSIETFGRQDNQVRCFDHIANLCAKSVLWPFDVKKKDLDTVLNEAEEALHELAEGLDLDDVSATQVPGEDDEQLGNNVERWIDEMDEMTSEEWEELSQKVYPVKVTGLPQELCLNT